MTKIEPEVTQSRRQMPVGNRFLLSEMATCMNCNCRNKVGEGTFVVVSFPPVGTSRKGILLVLCRPCDEELSLHLKSE